MIKTPLNIVLFFALFFLAITLMSSQSKNQNKVFTPINSSDQWANPNNIMVISILDNKNMNNLKDLDQFAAQYKYKNITFIAITDNFNDSLKISCKNELLHYRHLSEKENQQIFNTYQTGMYKVFPIHIILNKEGKLIYKKKGSTGNIQGKLAKRIDKLLHSDSKISLPHEIDYTIR